MMQDWHNIRECNMTRGTNRLYIVSYWGEGGGILYKMTWFEKSTYLYSTSYSYLPVHMQFKQTLCLDE